MKKKSVWLAVGVTVLLALTMCHSRINYPNANKQLYVLVNLHPDEGHLRMYSVNYQREGLIKYCTPMTILDVSEKQAKIRDDATGKVYTYLLQTKTMRTSIEEHLNKLFAESCDRTTVDKMSPVDKEGIESGTVKTGMSKEAVLVAIGYPPESETPDLASDRWKYWTNRMLTFVVEFKDGVVSNIIR